jgi:hypothetical protein
MFERMDNVPQASRTHCIRSPNAVSPMLCEASSDTEMWTQTTAHTTAVHLPDCRREINPTLRVYVLAATSLCYVSNLGIHTAHTRRNLHNRGSESLAEPEDITIGVVKGNGCDAECVRLSPIAHDALPCELFA